MSTDELRAPGRSIGPRASRLVVAAFAASAAFAVLGAARSDVEGLGGAAHTALERTGVENATTAVLMGYRAYDTFLELVVLLIAFAGLRASASPVAVERDAPSPVLDVLRRLLVPFLTLFAVYLLWAGGHSHGGAFQAGAVLAAAGLLAALADPEAWPERLDVRAARVVLVLGPLAFATAAVGAMLAGLRPLEYPSAVSKPVIVAIEAASMLTIAAALLALFMGRALLRDLDDDEGER